MFILKDSITIIINCKTLLNFDNRSWLVSILVFQTINSTRQIKPTYMELQLQIKMNEKLFLRNPELSELKEKNHIAQRSFDLQKWF
jgi:hypothetical protein